MAAGASCELTVTFSPAEPGAVTGTPGVGKLLTWARPKAGAVATQGWINPYLAIDSLTLMVDGKEFPAKLLDKDEAGS
jgi:uncharacterized Ntn-hydrolase superfamily protein